ncbi:ArcR family transcription regulator [Halosimplex carlsbadense 2-9-1]|uniref:ArcR family transcription regulator n=1 Tax=Halosimplex carlsbadense 2-9-1 TaxID=797114 RepID=M0D6W5_9EURY|nr:IclR family transcriptional regulator [Halosimplex carlsbadense]ELZ30553.1 ArcR family transcription regulator [Halosimplex carlsbadense 2-9-1]
MTGDSGGGSPRTLSTVSTAMEAVKAIEATDGTGVTELADRLDISKSSAHAYLATLEQSGFLVNRDGRYELSLMFFVLGEYARNRSLLDEMIIRKLDELAAETAHYTHLVTEENGRGINLYKGKGEAAVGDDYQRAKRQQRDYLHITASGKAILAFLPQHRVEAIVDRHGLPRRTANTITDREELFDHLATVRERGYAVNDEEEIEGLRAVGAPIRDRDGDVLGSISISGPTSLVDGDTFYEALPERVMETANIIEVNRNMSDRRSDIETLI